MHTTSSTYLTFVTSEGALVRVSIQDMLDSGHPIDPETGEDLELFHNSLVRENGDLI